MVWGLVIMMVLVNKYLGINTPTNNFRRKSSSRVTEKHANKALRPFLWRILLCEAKYQPQTLKSK